MQSQITEWSSALMTSLAAAMAMFFSSLPKILAFAVIIIVGWLIAAGIEKAVSALLRTVKFNELSKRSGFSDFVHKMGTESDSSGMIGMVVKWFVRLVALVVLVIAGLAAKALSSLVRGAASEGGLSNPDLLAKVASGMIWAFGIVVAVNQIGIATTLVNTLFMAVVGALALALGLSFGLGGRETAAQIVRNWYNRGQRNADQIERSVRAAADMSGDVANDMAMEQGMGVGSLTERRRMQRRAS